jgi:hypothetical protein
MRGTRLLRAFAMIVQIVVLVAVTTVGVGHVHAAPAAVGHAHVQQAPVQQAGDDVGHPGWAGSQAQREAADRADGSGDAVTADCGLCCCGHSAVGLSDGPVDQVGWLFERMLAGSRDVAFASVSLEASPEPPRSFA